MTDKKGTNHTSLPKTGTLARGSRPLPRAAAGVRPSEQKESGPAPAGARVALRIVPWAILLLTIAAGAYVYFAPRAQDRAPLSWRQTAGPTGGIVNVLLIDPQNSSVIYAGTSGGICTSRDGAGSWLCKSVACEVHALAIDPSKPQILYAGSSAGIYRSADSGETWSQANAGLVPRVVFSLAIDPMQPSTVYAGTDRQVFKSIDNGNTWGFSGEGLPGGPVWSMQLDPRAPNILYASTEDGIFKSEDHGQQWQRASDGMPDGLRVQMLAIHPQFPTILHAATEAGCFRSTDSAATWKLLSDGIGQSFVNVVSVDPSNVGVVYAAVGTQGVWRSTDRGDSWQAISSDINDLVLTLAVNPLDSTMIYVGTGRGVYRTNLASQGWEPCNQGLVGTSVLALAAAPGSGQLYATTGLDVFTSARAEEWELANRGLVRPNVLALATDPQSQNAVYAGTWAGEVYDSTDGGQNWHLANSGLARDAPISALLVHHIPGTNDSQAVLYAATNGAGVFVSKDGGVGWSAINDGLDELHVQALALSHTQVEMLHAGTSKGMYHLELPPYSSDAQLRWQSTQQGLPGEEISSIALDVHSPSLLYAATMTGLGEIYRSPDGGNSWAGIGRGSLPAQTKIQVLGFRSPSARQGTLYAGTDMGVFASADGGVTWTAMNEGLPAGANVLALLVEEDALNASIQNNGVFRMTNLVVSQRPSPWPLVGAMFVAAMCVGVLLGRSALLSSERVQIGIMERSWRSWQEQIRQELQSHNQVTINGLTGVPQALRLRVLQRYVREHQDDSLVVRGDPPILQPANALQAWDLVQNWNAAQQRTASQAAFAPVVTHIVEQLCQLLGFTLVDRRSYKNLHGYVVKAPALRLNLPSLFPIVFLQNPGVAEQDSQNLRDLLGMINLPSYVALLVVPDVRMTMGAAGNRQSDAVHRLRHDAAQDLIVLGFDDLYRIFIAKDPVKRFIQLVLEQVELVTVSPYVTSGPVPEEMFVGREQELKTITRSITDMSFAIVGGRKMGKTSLLTKLYSLFADSPLHYALYLDCQAVHNYQDFCHAAAAMWKLDWAQDCPEQLVAAIERLKQERAEQLVVILLDEADALLRYDGQNGQRLVRALCGLAQAGQCRFVVCGGRVVAASLHDPESALFDSCCVIHLGYLTPRDTGRIVLEPMQGMGVGFEDAGGTIQRIVDLTACHPNLVQYVCQQLVIRLNTRQDRLITLGDLDAIAGSRQFSEYFMQVMWGDVTALERLITLVMLNRLSFTAAEVDSALREQGVRVTSMAIQKALTGLVLCSILNLVLRPAPTGSEAQEYRFVAPAFGLMATLTQDIEALMRRTIQNLRCEPQDSENPEPDEATVT